MEFLPLIVFIAAWYFVAKYYKNKGHGAFVRHLAGFAVGLLGLVVTVLAVVPDKTDKSVSNDSKPQQLAENNQAKNDTLPDQAELTQKSDTTQVENTTPDLLLEQQIADKDEIKTEPEQVKPTQMLDLDVKKFSARINKALKNAQSPFKMAKNPKIKNGEVNDVANYMFTDRFGVILTLDKKTHKVKSMMTILTPSPTDSDENLVMLFSNAAVLSAFEGENEIKTVGKKILDLTMSVMTEYGETKKDVSKTMIWNGKKYGVSASQYTGIMSYADFAD